MPCYHPIDAWHSAKGVSFVPTIDAKDIRLPCGRCIGCRLERSRQWALRLTHEKRFHAESAFITLTYDENHLPEGGSLDLKHFQNFMKRLRFELSPKKKFDSSTPVNTAKKKADRIITLSFLVTTFCVIAVICLNLFVAIPPGRVLFLRACGLLALTAWVM